jgi:hypothetical protein
MTTELNGVRALAQIEYNFPLFDPARTGRLRSGELKRFVLVCTSEDGRRRCDCSSESSTALWKHLDAQLKKAPGYPKTTYEVLRRQADGQWTPAARGCAA